MKLALLPPGEFQMGTTDRELEQMLGIFAGAPGHWFLDEMPAHRVRLSQPFYLGVCEVTRREQYRRFVEATHYAVAEQDKRGGWGWNAEAAKFEGPSPKYSCTKPDSPRPIYTR